MTLNSVLLSGKFSIESIKSMELWAQGLFVVVVGLVGVFLVLFLFYITIILLQKTPDLFSRLKSKKDS